MRCINCMRKLKDGGGVCPHCGFDAAKYKPPNDALPPGSALNDEKYLIGRALGRGGFGITYVALDQNLGLPVAIKECLPLRGARRDASGASVQWSVPVHEQESAMENLVREARKMAKIYGIPGVVPVRGYFYDNDTAYIVMDYVEGETLAERLRRTGPLSAQECFRLLSPVMDTLAQAHKLQIDGESVVHRDIKPNNIMIGKIKGGEERVWLLDLGAAKDMGTRDSAPNVSVESRPVGTPGYMPLEQCSPDGRIGSWTDVYALSATFFYCMTGKKPPDSQSRASELQTPEVLLSIPGPLGDVLRKGMALHREERYQTIEELRDALEKALPKPKPKPPKWIPALVALLAMAVLIPLALMAIRPKPEIVASGECGENVSWTLDADGLLTISGTGNMQNYGNAPLNTPWLERNDAIIRVKILEGVTSIGGCAFYHFGNLQSVEIPDSVTEIGWGAFNSCASLPNITLPNHLSKIGGVSFDGCSSLKSIVIPDSVTEIGDTAFRSCASLESVTISNGVTTISEYTFQFCSNLASVVIPDSVTEIGKTAFYDCSSLRSVVIPDGVTEIPEYVFRGCSSLTDAVIPDSVTTIGEAAFNGCYQLSNITLPQNLTKIGAHAFSRCHALPNIDIPDSVTEIGEAAFYECSTFSNITIPNGVTEIKESAFYGCSKLESVTIPKSVRQIDDHAFQNCVSLTAVTIPQGTVNLLASVFEGCVALKSVDIPEGVQYINPYMFYGCSALESVTLPDSTLVIGAKAFGNCSSLASVSIPAETEVYADAFDETTTVTRRGNQDSTASDELDALNDAIQEEMQQENITF